MRPLLERPDRVEAYAAAAQQALLSGTPAVAEQLLRRARAIAPDRAGVALLLGLIAQQQGRTDVARQALERACLLDPADLRPYGRLAGIAAHDGDPQLAVTACLRWAIMEPIPRSVSAALYTLHFDSMLDARAIAERHARLGRSFGVPDPLPRRAARRPLRVGLVSGDFRIGSGRAFVTPLLRWRDPAEWQAWLFSTFDAPDSVTRRHTESFQALADQWVDLSALDDQAALERLRAAELDLVIDLSGHTVRNRLPVLARRVAPVQMTWMDYVNTTGVRAIDYLVADPHRIPPGHDGLYTEAALRLPHCALCYEPPASAPDPTPDLAPASDRPFTFGSFNQLLKLNRRVIATWAEILAAAPGARLMVSAGGLERPQVRHRLQAAFAAAGMAPGRVDLLGACGYREWLGRCDRVDLVLDSFPHSGCLTTCDSLWMGVPVLTFPGDRFASRLSAAHLAAAGLGEWISPDRDDYVARAIGWASLGRRSQAQRQALRGALPGTPFMDAEAFARSFERIVIAAAAA